MTFWFYTNIQYYLAFEQLCHCFFIRWIQENNSHSLLAFVVTLQLCGCFLFSKWFSCGRAAFAAQISHF